MDCIIIDDEPLARKLLASYIDKVSQLHLVGEFDNPLKALHFTEHRDVDIIFLDIQMPELNGVQFAKVIGPKAQIIFTTAYPDYAADGFDVKALDYLVKPISFERFLQAISRLALPNTMNETDDALSPDFMFVKTAYRLQKIDFDTIYFLQGMGDYCAIHLKDSKVLTLEKLKSFERRLPTHRFIRVHKSYMVALDKIEFVEKQRIVIGEHRIPIGASYDAAFKKLLR